MADDTGSQRYYRAPCPGCGAPVEFRSAQSTFAVCAYCQSTVVRQGETLARIGKMAELFDDFSPLQLFSAGRIQDKPFTLVGRLQYAYEGGRWTEWIAQLDGDRTGTLSEDNGAHVFTLPYELKQPAPSAGALVVGATTAFNGQNYTVASNQQVTLVSAQGELPKLPDLGKPFAMVELRNDQGLVLSLDYGSMPPAASLGRSVLLDDLKLTGLRDESGKEEKGRGFNCPNCGAPVTVNFADSKTITCRACNSIIDLTQGIGGELKHAEQAEPVRPLIALGALGQLQGASWQVVGFQHRMGQEPGDDEMFGWDEYLLYNKKRGFSFLVDATDGWSMVQPTTGAPTMAESGSAATYMGKRFQQQYAYNAETTYVAGEFYWKVERGQKTFNRDFAAGATLLSMERSANELTWSSGGKLDSATVASAFKLDAKKDMFKRGDVLPVSAALGSGLGCGTIILIGVVIVVLLIILSTCSSSSGGSRSSGGSYGGFSSGGGHK
ncbi:ribosomal protein S27E [Variovorax sp. GrIS 2.14]|uniref:DUF4178 domain-containing protein n=1 Tax=Variovorax sp. GrIS 2.14 TaxID=3071709 RepID=UPI0038F7F68B